MSNSSLIAFVESRSAALRKEGAPEALFLAAQLDRVAQLLAFTGANTPEEYDARTELNEHWVAEKHFGEGYSAGRSAVHFEIAHGIDTPSAAPRN
jgi:hypothetical protein